MSESTERAAFEADAAPMGFDLTRQSIAVPEPWAEYADEHTGHRWAGWLARASLAEGKAEPAWRTMETAPRDGTHVLIANDAPGSVHPREGYYVAVEHRYQNEPTHEGWWRLAGSSEERVHGRTPTHWKPLPSPPSMDGAVQAATRKRLHMWAMLHHSIPHSHNKMLAWLCLLEWARLGGTR